jgi:PBP1b-binding outer membrane lipoprotein LpoB
MRHSTAIHSATRIPTAVSALLAASALLLGSGCQNAKYVDPKGNELVVNVDRMNIQDWSMLSDQVVQSMVSSGTLARLPAQPAGLLLNPVVNTTTQQFDTDAIMKKIRIALINTGRVEVIMADDLFGGAEDRIADITITAKLLEDRARAGSTRQVAYILQMSLTNTTTGRSVWEGEAQIVKQGERASVGF